MARTPSLNWCPGSGNRKGRWRVRYRGKSHYFSAGRGKSDRVAKQAAEAAWAERKRELDAHLEQEKPHREEYLRLIAEWGCVRDIARERGEAETIARAEQRIVRLEQLLTTDSPPPPSPSDRFDGLTLPPYRLRDDHYLNQVPHDVMQRFLEDHRYRSVWQDRLTQEDDRPPERTLAVAVNRFLEKQDLRLNLGQITKGRRESLRAGLKTLVDALGGNRDVSSIPPEFLSDYFLALSKLVDAGTLTSTTASDKLAVAKMLIRSLWSDGIIPELPRNIDSHDLRFSRVARDHVMLTVEEVQQAVCPPTSNRTRCYLFLALNCGFTQADIAGLTWAEWDRERGTLTHKRVKTRGRGSVPTVQYALWPETQRSLEQEGGSHPELVLVNRRGEPLRTETVGASGAYRKIDNIRSAWIRLTKRTGLSQPFSSLRKTSATLLRSNARYATVVQQFLGHAPTSVADRHYAAAPQLLLDEAIGWLRTELRIADSPLLGEMDREEALRTDRPS